MVQIMDVDVSPLLVRLSEMLAARAQLLKKAQNPLSVFVYLVVPFYYAFTEGSGFFRLAMYPALFVAPWIMMVFKKTAETVEIVHLTTPFVGLVFLLYGIECLFSRRQRSTVSLILSTVGFLALTVATAFVPIVPFSYRNGLAIQISYPFLEPELAFGIKFYKSFQASKFIEFIVGGFALPLLAHSWIICGICAVVSLLRLLLRFCTHHKKQADEKTQ